MLVPHPAVGAQWGVESWALTLSGSRQQDVPDCGAGPGHCGPQRERVSCILAPHGWTFQVEA